MRVQTFVFGCPCSSLLWVHAVMTMNDACSMIFVRHFAHPFCLPMMNIHSIINMLRAHSDIAYVAEELLNIFMNAIVHVGFASIAQRNAGTMFVLSNHNDNNSISNTRER